MSAIEYDAYYPLSFEFTTQDFEESLDEAVGGHVEFGLYPWLDTRLGSLEGQLDPEVPVLIVHEVEDNAPVLDSLRIRAIVDGGGDAVEVTCWIDAGPGPVAYTMYDDGEHGDRKAGDGTWGIKVPVQWNWPATVTYHVQATSSAGLERWIPCAPEIVTVGTSPSELVIHELRSSNANNVSDEFLEFEDWVELFNAGGTPVELGGKYLTDNLSVPNKYALPSGYLAAGDWTFYWLDNDPEQGPFHAPFTLSASGDEIALLEWDDAGGFWIILDFFAFGAPEQQDISLGRYPDGADYWVWFATPPDATNNYAIILGQDELNAPVQRRFARIHGGLDPVDRGARGRVLDAAGREVLRFPASRGLSLGDRPAAVYLLELEDGTRTRLVKADTFSEAVGGPARGEVPAEFDPAFSALMEPPLASTLFISSSCDSARSKSSNRIAA